MFKGKHGHNSASKLLLPPHSSRYVSTRFLRSRLVFISVIKTVSKAGKCRANADSLPNKRSAASVTLKLGFFASSGRNRSSKPVCTKKSQGLSHFDIGILNFL